jgi:hypothetical protein
MSLQPIPSAARPSISAKGIGRNMSMGPVAVTKASRMGTMWIIWLTATFIIRTVGTVTTTGLLPLPELPMQRGGRVQDCMVIIVSVSFLPETLIRVGCSTVSVARIP